MKVATTSFLFLLVLCGCTEADSASRRATVRDSAGVEIVENTGPYREWRLASEPDTRIGTVDGDSVYQFYRVQFAGRLSDGRIVVVDGSRAVRWYGADGLFRSAVGRQGGGPGEFGVISSVLITPTDTVVVGDLRNRRATWLSPAEDYVREVSLREIPNGTLTLLAQIAADRLALATSRTPFGELRPDITYLRDTLTVVQISSDGRQDTVVHTLGNETALWAEFSGGQALRVAALGLPFAHRAYAAATAEQYALADGESHEIRFHRWNGQLARIARWPDESGVQLTDQDRERFIAELLDKAMERGTADLGAVEENGRSQLGALPAGHTMPSFDALLFDSEGRLWLRRFEPIWAHSTVRVWTVFGPNGRVERKVSIPVEFNVMHVDGDHVTGVERDSFDVEYVAVYRLEEVGAA